MLYFCLLHGYCTATSFIARNSFLWAPSIIILRHKTLFLFFFSNIIYNSYYTFRKSYGLVYSLFPWKNEVYFLLFLYPCRLVRLNRYCSSIGPTEREGGCFRCLFMLNWTKFNKKPLKKNFFVLILVN